MLHTLIRKTLSTIFYLPNSFKSREGIIVLNYHRVNDCLEPNDLVVDTKTFRQQMEYLHENKYRVIGIEEMIKLLRDTGQIYYPRWKTYQMSLID